MEPLSLLGHEQLPIVQTAYLVCLLWIVTAKQDRIRDVRMFRMACSLFAVDLIVPSLLNLYYFSSAATVGGADGSKQNYGLFMWLSTLGPLLLISSFLLSINSLMPARASRPS